MNIIKTYQVELSQPDLTQIRQLLDIQIDGAETRSATAAARGSQAEMDKWDGEAARLEDIAMNFADCSIETVEHRHPDANAVGERHHALAVHEVIEQLKEVEDQDRAVSIAPAASGPIVKIDAGATYANSVELS